MRLWGTIVFTENATRVLAMAGVTVAEGDGNGGVVTRGSRLRVRGGPGTDSPVVGYRNTGDEVQALERRGEWTRIGTGQWVHSDFVEEGSATPGAAENGDVIAHPRNPRDSRWRLLIGFETNQETLRPAHRRWLASVAAGQAHAGQYVWVRGLASRLGDPAANMALSQRRARAVRDFLVEQHRVPPNQVTGINGIGVAWAGGSETDDSPRWRAAEVIITDRVVPLPGVVITGATPVSSVFWIKYMGSGTGGEAFVGEVVLSMICTRSDHWQRYLYGGVGVGGGAPVSWGEALPPRQGWVRFSTGSPVSVGSFVGSSRVLQAAAQIGGAGVGAMIVHLPHGVRVQLPTGAGFSLGASGSEGPMMTAGTIELRGNGSITEDAMGP